MDKTLESTDVGEMTKTASFLLTIRQLMWIRDEADRRGMNMSELMRDVVAKAMLAEAERSAA